MLWRNGYTPDLYAYYEAGKIEDFHDRQSRFMKAVDRNKNLVAASDWTFSLDPEVEAKKELTKADAQPPVNWPENGNWELKRFFKIEWEKWRRLNLGGRAYISTFTRSGATY